MVVILVMLMVMVLLMVMMLVMLVMMVMVVAMVVISMISMVSWFFKFYYSGGDEGGTASGSKPGFSWQWWLVWWWWWWWWGLQSWPWWWWQLWFSFRQRQLAETLWKEVTKPPRLHSTGTGGDRHHHHHKDLCLWWWQWWWWWWKIQWHHSGFPLPVQWWFLPTSKRGKEKMMMIISFTNPFGKFTLDWIFLHNHRLWWLWQRSGL